jgi:hypothetical protein
MRLYQQTEGGPWWCDFTPPNGERFRGSLKTKDRREAERRAKELERASFAGSLIRDAKPVAVNTLEDAYTRALKVHYRDHKDSEGIPGRWATLSRFVDTSQDVKAYNRLTAENVVIAMREATWQRGSNGTPHKYSDATINRCLSLLGKLLMLAHPHDRAL